MNHKRNHTMPISQYYFVLSLLLFTAYNNAIIHIRSLNKEYYDIIIQNLIKIRNQNA